MIVKSLGHLLRAVSPVFCRFHPLAPGSRLLAPGLHMDGKMYVYFPAEMQKPADVYVSTGFSSGIAEKLHYRFFASVSMKPAHRAVKGATLTRPKEPTTVWMISADTYL